MKILYNEDLGRTRSHTKFQFDGPSSIFFMAFRIFGPKRQNFPAYNMGPYGKISIWDLFFHVFKRKNCVLIINFFLNSHILIVKSSFSFPESLKYFHHLVM